MYNFLYNCFKKNEDGYSVDSSCPTFFGLFINMLSFFIWANWSWKNRCSIKTYINFYFILTMFLFLEIFFYKWYIFKIFFFIKYMDKFMVIFLLHIKYNIGKNTLLIHILNLCPWKKIIFVFFNVYILYCILVVRQRPSMCLLNFVYPYSTSGWRHGRDASGVMLP